MLEYEVQSKTNLQKLNREETARFFCSVRSAGAPALISTEKPLSCHWALSCLCMQKSFLFSIKYHTC